MKIQGPDSQGPARRTRISTDTYSGTRTLSFQRFYKQARREGGVGGLATPGPATFGGPAIGQKFIKYARM